MRRRPTLNMLDANETAIIWNPLFGFRLVAPEHDRIDALSLPETFLTILSMRLDEELMLQLTGDYLAKFKKH